MKRTFLVKKDPTIEAQDNWLIMDYRQYAAWRETDEGKNREIVFGKRIAIASSTSEAETPKHRSKSCLTAP